MARAYVIRGGAEIEPAPRRRDRRVAAMLQRVSRSTGEDAVAILLSTSCAEQPELIACAAVRALRVMLGASSETAWSGRFSHALGSAPAIALALELDQHRSRRRLVATRFLEILATETRECWIEPGVCRFPKRARRPSVAR